MNWTGPTIPLPSDHPAAADYLAGDGEMAALVRSRDWSLTPLGPIERWPQSLRTTVSLCLASNFPINLIWGPEHTQIYNDGYRVLCGDAHPAALGQGYDVTWASAWPAIGGPFARARAGETSFLENQRMFLTRNGYLEETFFTFSLSPIRDESGGIGGLFHPVTETTPMMLAERRNRALRDLNANLGAVTTFADLASATIRTLAGFEFDLPFVMIYELDSGRSAYRLRGHHGIQWGGPASPEQLDGAAAWPWPVDRAAAAGGIVEVGDVADLMDGIPCGPYDEAPNHAFVLPVTLPGIDRPPIMVILGVSPRLPIHNIYRDFYGLLSAAFSAALARIRAREDERRRAEALAAIDHAKTAFFSNVSHEFRTPLTLMLGPLEDALDQAETLSVAQRERFQVVYRNALRLLRLVNTLLDFSRIEAGRTQARFEPASLAAITVDLVSNFESACARAGLSLVVDCPPLPLPVYVDRDMWEKIVLNLLSNAFKFTLAGGISVSLRDAGGNAQLVVHDTGVGIPAGQLPRLFERFHRIEGQQRRTHEGTGIGLALVRELVTLHGGVIEVESVEREGTVFYVTLPFGSSHLPADRVLDPNTAVSTTMPASAFVEEALRWLPDQAEAAPSVPAAPEERMKPDAKPRVLIADDNADMRAYIRRILEDGGYTVEAAGDGSAALAACLAGPPPDMILSDVMMPPLDGFQLLRALRADPATEGLPVVLLSARAGDEARVEGLTAGADDYLVKPFSARELRARVDGAVRLARQRRESAARERELQTNLATARSQAELRETAQRLEHALKAGRLGSWEQNLITGEFIASEICRSNFSWPAAATYDHATLLDSIHPADRPLLRDRVAEAIANRSDLDVEYRIVRPGGDVGWVQVRGRASYTEDGRPLCLTGVSLDITDRKHAEERQRALLDELNHRVKNTLAAVQSIALQTHRTAGDPTAFSDAFESRLGALAGAHELLTHTCWEGTSLANVVALALAPYARTVQGQDRVAVAGPPVRLGPTAAVTLNLAFHELVMNAARYGALSVDNGRVGVQWWVDRLAEPRTLAIDWTEHDGPAVAPPSLYGLRFSAASQRPSAGARRLRRDHLRAPGSGLPHALRGFQQDRGRGMMERRETLAGFRMLVVEDEALVAMLIEDYLTELGLAVVEVAGTLDRGLALATDAGRVIDGAILDINLGTEKVFPVAAALADRGIPFVFATGYGIDGLGTDYAGYPVIAKPFRLEQLRQFLLSAFS